jgi:GNAT superfamily N-acetyltransferase
MIRAAHREDAVAIAALLEQLGYPQEPGAVDARLTSWLADDSSRVLVAESGGTPVGVIALHVCPYFERPGRWARVTALAVDERHRRAGLGGELLAAAEEIARELGCSAVEVTCRRERDAAQAFYHSRGYEDVCARSARFERVLSD